MASEIKIGELAHSSRGSFKIGPFGSSLKKEDLSNEGVPVAGIENIHTNQFIPRFRRFISEKKFAELSDYQIEPDDILISTMGTIGRAAVAPSNIGTVIIDSHLFRMRLDTNRVYPPYLCYAINGYQGLKRQLKQMARGAIMDGLNTTILKECSIPLFALDEQKRIAAILDKSDRLRRQRHFAQTLSDSFLRSVFIKMFGDPASNPMNWKQIIFGKGIKLKSGDFLNGANMNGKGKYPVYGGNGINGYHSSFLFKERKIVIGRVGAYCGAVHYSKPFSWITDNALYVVRKPSELSELFLVYLLHYSDLNQYSGQSGQPLISEGRLANIMLIAPPLRLQDKFAEIVQKFERIRRQQREATRQAEHLFQTLLHRAFRGELWANLNTTRRKTHS